MHLIVQKICAKTAEKGLENQLKNGSKMLHLLTYKIYGKSRAI